MWSGKSNMDGWILSKTNFEASREPLFIEAWNYGEVGRLFREGRATPVKPENRWISSKRSYAQSRASRIRKPSLPTHRSYENALRHWIEKIQQPTYHVINQSTIGSGAISTTSIWSSIYPSMSNWESYSNVKKNCRSMLCNSTRSRWSCSEPEHSWCGEIAI